MLPSLLGNLPFTKPHRSHPPFPPRKPTPCHQTVVVPGVGSGSHPVDGRSAHARLAARLAPGPPVLAARAAAGGGARGGEGVEARWGTQEG